MNCGMCGFPLMPVCDEKGHWRLACVRCGAEKAVDLVAAPSEAAGSFALQGWNFLQEQCFDSAEESFRKAAERGKDLLAYQWALLLAKYGVKYCKSDTSGGYAVNFWRKDLPERFLSKDPLFQELSRAAAMKDRETLKQYKAAAQEIDSGLSEIYKNWGVSYDVFLCAKDRDAESKTPESKLCDGIYDNLMDRGLKVFFAPRTLKRKSTTNFEGYIYSALRSAKVLLIVTSSRENVTAPWVVSEWQRFQLWNAYDSPMVCMVGDMSYADFPEELKCYQVMVCAELTKLKDEDKINSISGEVEKRYREIVAPTPTPPAPEDSSSESQEWETAGPRRWPWMLLAAVLAGLLALGVVYRTDDGENLLQKALSLLAGPTPSPETVLVPSPTPDFEQVPSPTPDFEQDPSPTPDFEQAPSPTPDFEQDAMPVSDFEQDSMSAPDFEQGSLPAPDFEQGEKPTSDFEQNEKHAPDLGQDEMLALDFAPGPSPTPDSRPIPTPEAEPERSPSPTPDPDQPTPTPSPTPTPPPLRASGAEATPLKSIALRTGPSSPKYMEIHTLPQYVRFVALAREGKWLLVEYGYEDKLWRGYALASHMELEGSAGKVEYGKKKRTVDHRVRVYAAPYDIGAHRGVLHAGDSIKILQSEGDYLYVEYYEDEMDQYARGYVNRRALDGELEEDFLPSGNYVVADCEEGIHLKRQPWNMAKNADLDVELLPLGAILHLEEECANDYARVTWNGIEAYAWVRYLKPVD